MVLPAKHIPPPSFGSNPLFLLRSCPFPTPMRSQQDNMFHSQTPKEALVPVSQADPTDSSKNLCIERRNTWPEGCCSWVLQKADPKEMSMSFCLGMPWFLILPRLSPPKPGQVLLWCQELPNILPIRSLCLFRFVFVANDTDISAQELIADNTSCYGLHCVSPQKRYVKVLTLILLNVTFL